MPRHGREFSEIGADEPVFVIRGQDRAAIAAMHAYMTEAKRLGAAPRLLHSVARHIVAVGEFQMANGSKVPDLK